MSGPPVAGVVVGRVVQRLDRDAQRRRLVCLRPVQLLERRLGEQRSGPDRVVPGTFLVPAADHVVRHDPAGAHRRRSRPDRIRRAAAPRPGPAWPHRGCRAPSTRGGSPCRRRSAGRPRSSRNARVRPRTAAPVRSPARRYRRYPPPSTSSVTNTFCTSRLAIRLPIVARRSPAISTPPAKVSATIVVPCGAMSDPPSEPLRTGTGSPAAAPVRGSRR